MQVNDVSEIAFQPSRDAVSEPRAGGDTICEWAAAQVGSGIEAANERRRKGRG